MINTLWRKKSRFTAIMLAAMLFLMIVAITVRLVMPSLALLADAVTICAIIAAAVTVYSFLAFAKNELSFLETQEKNIPDFASIRFDTREKKAYISPNVPDITGLTLPCSVLSEEEYGKLMEELISSPYDLAESVYMSCIPERWLRITSFNTTEYECTAIRDVSRYVSCKNVIKSLKYYDTTTGILSREAFVSQLRKSAEENTETIGLIHIVTSGIERVMSFSGTTAADHIIMKIAAFLKKYENPHNTFVGRTATDEFSVLLTETYDDGCRKFAEKICSGLQDMLEKLPSSEKNNVRAFCGYAYFHRSDSNVGTMMSSADFAAFDAESQNSSIPVLFNSEIYSKRAHEFKQIQVFNTVISQNIIDYHFQPIVNARTGSIFGYEALMRPRAVDGIKLTPLEMLGIAEQQDMLYEIERLTFTNVLRLLSENQDFFSSRKLFINCIPNYMLSDSDYNSILELYGELFEKLVIEITEGGQVIDGAVKSIQQRFKSHKAQVALDDYGAGYANESTLLSVQPDYVKIDRSIITGIESDPQKQHLVSNMVNFASQHGIKTLAEGVETTDELETVISLGVDLIQGFVACKATAILMLDIPVDVKSEIINCNLKYAGYVNKTYEITNDTPVDIVNLALFGYTDIVIHTRRAFLTGDKNIPVNMRISCDDSTSTIITISNLNVSGLNSPVLTLGKYCDVVLKLEGKNIFSYEGIRVPETSKFGFSGRGDLSIECNHNNPVCIGGNYIQDYGNIVFDGEGKINIVSKGDNLIGVGGGIASENSFINVLSGNISINLKGATAIGIGSYSGVTKANLSGAKIQIIAGAQKAVLIGTKTGQVDLESSAALDLQCSGDVCCAIGVISKGTGDIRFEAGNCKIILKAKAAVGLGSFDSNVNVNIASGLIDIYGEGDAITGIGDRTGNGTVRISNAVICEMIKSAEERPIFEGNGKVVIMSGNIYTNSVTEISTVNQFDEPLKCFRLYGKEEFRTNITCGETPYTYTAEPLSSMDYISVYLPENFEHPRCMAEI